MILSPNPATAGATRTRRVSGSNRMEARRPSPAHHEARALAHPTAGYRESRKITERKRRGEQHGSRTGRRSRGHPRVGNVAGRRGRAEGLSLPEDPRQRGRHPLRGVHHGHREGAARGGVAHAPPSAPEVYLVLEGTGSVQIGPDARPVEAGSAVFRPGDAPHSLANTGPSDLRFAYVFAAGSFDEVGYSFEE